MNYLMIAKGSTEETISQLYRCKDQELITEIRFNDLYHQSDILIKRTPGLINYLNISSLKGSKFKNRQ